jgi:redox-sensitive bicupin YhaK (pirin superfamily)
MIGDVSGPVTSVDAPPDQRAPDPPGPPVAEVFDDREAKVGNLTVRRALPRRGRRTVGAWCFADHMGPADVVENSGLDIGPHPHIGLHTVTWLVDGALLHRDSLGSEQLIRPGQLNLMTAGRGVVHAEEMSRTYRGALQGIQLWVAQPAETRDGAAAFEHHADLPAADLDNATAVVLVGSLADATSPARHDTELVGAELTVRRGGAVVPVRRDFEHALVVIDGEVAVGESVVRPGQLAYVGMGRDELPLASADGARLLLLGGVPFAEPIVMWWNFVARTKEEMAQARTQWATGDERFGAVDTTLPRIPAPPAL